MAGEWRRVRQAPVAKKLSVGVVLFVPVVLIVAYFAR
jgi:hypothetical protein